MLEFNGVLATHAVSEPTVSLVRGTVQDKVENMCLMCGMEEDEIPSPSNQQFRETAQELLSSISTFPVFDTELTSTSLPIS